MLGAINHHIGVVVQLHNVIHIFCSGRGTGTTYLEAKLLRKLTIMKEEFLYEVFLNLRKAYDVLDLDKCMEILVGYGLGPQTKILSHNYFK